MLPNYGIIIQKNGTTKLNSDGIILPNYGIIIPKNGTIKLNSDGL